MPCSLNLDKKGVDARDNPRIKSGDGHDANRENNMPIRHHSIRGALLAATMLATPAFAADVTPERLVNADKEPQNWLMEHRNYERQRFSPLTRINLDTVE